LDGENGTRLGGERGRDGFDPTHPAVRVVVRADGSWKALGFAAALDGRTELPSDGGEPVPRPAPLAVSGGGSLGISALSLSAASRHLGLRIGRQSLNFGPT